MSAHKRRLSLLWILAPFLAGVMTVTMFGTWFQSEPTQAAKGTKGEAQLDLLVSIPNEICPDGSRCVTIADTLEEVRGLRGFTVDSFFDVEYGRVYSNIGSSGLDGARFSVDSFFDISLFGDPDFDLFGDPDFDLFGDPDFDMVRISARGQLTDPSNPGLLLDEVDRALRGHKHRGHVTILK